MSCEPSDWEKVSDLATQNPQFIISAFGIHPWKAQEHSNWDQEPELVQKLENLLCKHPNAVIGEIGLDFHANRLVPTESHQTTEFLKQNQIQVSTSIAHFHSLCQSFRFIA
jgi:Tat protein secretion system quality control protein TatD with DNase activity